MQNATMNVRTLLALCLLASVAASRLGAGKSCADVGKASMLKHGTHGRDYCRACMGWRGCSWCPQYSTTRGGSITGKCRSATSGILTASDQCDEAWMTASGFRGTDANQAQCDKVYNEDDGSHKAQKASMRKAHKALLYSSSLLTSDIDADVHQGMGTTQAQIREENEYVAAMKKRESGAAAFCDVEENLESGVSRRGSSLTRAERVERCKQGYNSNHVPPKQPAFMKGRKKDGSYKSQLEKNWEDLV